MSLIKRLSTTLFSRIDQVVGEIENHDALIKAAINEQRKKIAAAKVQLCHVQDHEARLQQQIEQLGKDHKRWSDRALAEAQGDRDRALACMQRRQQVREQIGRLQQAKQDYQRAADKMRADIARCDEQLKVMSQKHDLMRARQSSADALQVINHMEHSRIDELASSFERWESKIVEEEILVDSFDDVDLFAQQYLDEENTRALHAELEQLITEEKGHGID